MTSSPARRLGAAGLEVLLAVGLTLGCFLVFLGLLEVAFPKGQSLHSLLASRADTRPVEAVDPGLEATRIAKSVASLAVLSRAVRSRPAGAITWTSAATGLALHDGDGVQTGPEGRALISFGEALRIELEKNSLVVVSDPNEGATAASASDRPRGVIMLEGELWARMRSGTQEPLAITLPSATASLGGHGQAGATMQVSVRRDGRTTLAVHGGRAALRGSGPAMELGPGQFVRVENDGAMSTPLQLPTAPAVIAPGPGAEYGYVDLPPRVPFRWRSVENAQQYRVRAARDSGFKEVVLDETVTQPSLTWGRLEPGTYYWQVSGIIDDVVGLPSPARSLVVRRDDEQIHLKVATPQVENMRCVVRGRAARRLKVFVVGQRVNVESDGTFQTVIELEPGANVLVVEAVDPAGQSTYWSQVVYAKP